MDTIFEDIKIFTALLEIPYYSSMMMRLLTSVWKLTN